MLTLKDIYMKYESNDQEVLKNINLTLPDSGLIFIIGPSGSGKSTLLNLIAGFMKPTSGSILFNDEDITKFKGHRLDDYIAKDIAFIHQKYNLLPYLTVDDNIKIKNKNYDSKILKRLRIDHLKKKMVKQISGGESQRVAIARALVNSSSIILADEPTGALDSKNSRTIMKIFKKLAKDHLVIIVTHNNELIRGCDEIIKIQDGSIKSHVHKSKVINHQKRIKQPKINKDILAIVLKNIRYKWKRNLITTLAFSIGLITLLLVLSISKGFNAAISDNEKTTMATYPLIINENSYDIDKEIDEIFASEKVSREDVIIQDTNHYNKIDDAFIDYVDNLKPLCNNIEKTYLFNNVMINNISNPSFFYKNVDLLAGHYLNGDNEVLLLLDKNNSVSSDIGMMLNLDQDKYKYEDLIDKKIDVSGVNFNIVGIIKGKGDSFYTDISGLYTKDTFGSIPININIIPKDYEAKQKIINSLNDYSDIEFTDYASSIKNISSNIIHAITIVLVIFSLISLSISSFMIGIITYISVLERIKDIGILKSIGYRNSDIKNIFYLENIIIALVSAMLSIITIIILSIPINRVLMNLTGFNNILLLNIDNFMNIMKLSILVSLLGSFIPIHKTKKLSIVDALNYE